MANSYQHNGKIFVMTILVVALTGSCGTIVGNPSKPSQGGSESGTTPPKAREIPLFSFDFPDAIMQTQTDDSAPLAATGDYPIEAKPLTLSLADFGSWNATNGDGDVLKHFVGEGIWGLLTLNTAIKDLNSNQDLTENGAYEHSDDSVVETGKIEELAGTHGVSSLRMVACRGGKPYMQITWTDDQSDLLAKWLRKSDVDKPEADRSYKQIRITKVGSQAEIAFNFSGTPRALDPLRNGEKRAAAYRVRQVESGDFHYRAVTAWFDNPDDPFIPNRYVSALSSSVGIGDVLAWSTECDNVFDEKNAANPGWCYGRSINNIAGFSAEERAAAQSRIADVGIEEKSALEIVSFDKDLSCQ